MSNCISGGCSFTFGNELSDDFESRYPSKKSWAYQLYSQGSFTDYICSAKGGIGNSAIARNVFKKIHEVDNIECVSVMWTFISRYDWAMPPHKILDEQRWASITPWETDARTQEVNEALGTNEIQQQLHDERQENFNKAGVRPFANSLYRYAANDYHETFLSLKSIIWLQNILEKRKIPYFFTLADNTLFYDNTEHKKNTDTLMQNLYSELDLTKWFFFGERCMGFNQWALLNDYPRGTTHPLDDAHDDAVKLMLPSFKKTIGEKHVQLD
jgi:hypothetical protein